MRHRGQGFSYLVTRDDASWVCEGKNIMTRTQQPWNESDWIIFWPADIISALWSRIAVLCYNHFNGIFLP